VTLVVLPTVAKVMLWRLPMSPEASVSAASRGPGSGTPNVASSASPMNFSRQPLWRTTIASIRRWKSRSKVITSSGVISSAMVVKPSRSAKGVQL
jgi:hypothetical protein